MGFQLGGLIIKQNQPELVSDRDLLRMFGKEHYHYRGETNMEEATSASLHGVGIVRIDNAILVFGRDLPHSCSFEEEESSEVDKDLEKVSRNADIVCFLMNTVSDVYAWSIFLSGKRVRVKTRIGDKSVFDYGAETEYDENLPSTEKGMLQLIENFSGYSYMQLVFGMDLSAKCYA